MSPAARLMGKAFPVAIRTAITLPPGPTRGPPRFPGRSAARSVSCTSLRWVTTAGVEGRRVAAFGLASRTAGSAGCSTAASPKGRGVPSLAPRISASPSVASMPITRTGWVPPVLSMSRRRGLPSTRLAAVRKSPCVSIRKAVPKVWSLTIVITPARSRSSSSGSSTAAGGTVGEGVGAGVAVGWARRWAAVGIRTASPATTSATTSAVSNWSLRSPRRGPTSLQRSKASYTFITMRLRNTETNAVQPLEPHSGPVRLYVCGITPYDTTHLGHAFTYVVFDVLVRVLRAAGQPVRYVQNVTDVDDDIIRRARELGTTWDHLADKETALYVDDMAALNVLAPDVFPRASQTIPKIIALISRLEAQGHAYQRDGNVYFRVGSVADYGRLSRLSLKEMVTLSAQRGADPNDPRKQDPLDFVLWQVSALGEPRWESPWGVGRPGWHIECSAMALEHLGPQVDVHGGGADLIYPHHESEIAQSESATGVRPFARIWAHVGMLRYQGEKMSKSLRNLVLVRDLLPRYDADSIRVLLLRHHYREPWEYTPDQLDDAAAWTERLRAAAGRTRDGMGDSALAVRAALEDDLDTSGALRVLEEAVESGDRGWRSAADLLGLGLSAPAVDREEMKKALGWRAPFS